MSGARSYPVSVYAALKTETRRLVDAAGGVEAAASYTRVASSNIARYYAPHEAGSFIAIDVALDLMRATGDVRLLAALAQRLDHVLLPMGADLTDAAWRARLASLGKEISEVFAAFASMDGDGRHEPGELRATRGQIMEAMQALSRMLAAVDRELSGGRVPE